MKKMRLIAGIIFLELLSFVFIANAIGIILAMNPGEPESGSIFDKLILMFCHYEQYLFKFLPVAGKYPMVFFLICAFLATAISTLSVRLRAYSRKVK